MRNWGYAGRGWTNPADAWLAETAAGELTETRRLAQQARRTDRRRTDRRQTD